MPNNTKLCSFGECQKKVKARGLCQGHALQIQRGENLTPLGGRSATTGMSLHDRFEHYVDRTGVCHVWTGKLNNKGYALYSIGGKFYFAHRVAYEWVHGAIPPGAQIDHSCHSPACVNTNHLRVTSHKQNQENRGPLTASNTSGYRGVSFDKRRHKWYASVSHGGTKHHVGSFDDVHEAGAAALAKRMELFTHSDGR